jgi:hypothetical protein
MRLQYAIQHAGKGIRSFHVSLLQLFRRFTRRKAQGKLHFEFLISFYSHRPAEAMHAGIRHIAGIRQIGNGHKKNCTGIFSHIIGNFFFGFGKLVI